MRELKDKFSKEEIKYLRQAAKEFAERLAVEFAHNLQRGWEGKLLNEGRVLTYRDNKELFTVKEIKENFHRDGKIQFFAYGKNRSLKVVNKLMKPPHLCWQ